MAMGINIQYYKKQKDPYKTIPDMARVISGYICALNQENCDEAVRNDTRGKVAYHLASERKSAVSWYPFKENAHILEVGGEFGAITGELCDKASKVVVTEASLFRAEALSKRYCHRENLEIYAGQLEDIEFLEQFDYIIVMNPVSTIGNHTINESIFINNLKRLAGILKADGKLLFAHDNLYSIGNCRKEDGSLNPNKHLCKLYHALSQRMLKNAGFEYLKFYYPLPNLNVVGRIYTDEILPSAVEWNCLANYACKDQNYLASSMDMYQRLTENGMFQAFAPAYFIEASRVANLCNIKKANVLFDESFELPVLGFEWSKHGYASLREAINQCRYEANYDALKDQRKSYVLQIDQDCEIVEKVVGIELELLRKLQEVCEAHNLKLYAMYGTLLGAVRHAGMIPGDDDIDVALSREDYQKLLELEHEFSGQYFLQTPENDDCFYGGYLKLRRCDTTAVHPQNWWVNCCEGISIDIFPLDSGFENKKKETAKRRKIKILQRLLYAKAYGYFPQFKDMKLLKWKAYKYIGKVFSRKQLCELLEREMASTDGSPKAPLGIYAHYLGTSGPRLFSKDAFEETISIPYENMKLLAPKEWNAVLRSLYGEKYMTPHNWNEGKRRHGFYDSEHSYEIWKERFRGLFRPEPAENQKIVLFGDEGMFKTYLKQNGSAHRPNVFVSLSDHVLEKEISGIDVISMEAFKKMNMENIYPVICALDVRSAQACLEKAGIKKFHVFLKKRDWMLLANYSFGLKELEV